MIPKFILNWVVTAIALACAAKLVSGINIEGSWTTYVWIAIVFGLVNATIGSAFRLVTLPFAIVSLGLSLLIINALMLGLTAALIGSFTIDGFGSALLASLIVSAVSMLLNVFVVKPLTNGG